MLRGQTSSSRFAVPVVVTLIALVLVVAFVSSVAPAWPGQVSIPLLLLAVVVSAWHGGLAVGVTTACFCWLALELILLPPAFAIELSGRDMPRLVAFLATAILIGRLSDIRRQMEADLHRTEQKLKAARLIQQRLMPVDAPDLPGFDIAGASYPANTVGGDYFDFVPMAGHKLGLVVGDVSGHGLGPSLLMAETRASLRALALTHDDVGEILTLTNRMLVADTDSHFLTLFFASLDPQRRAFVYSGAGHEGYLLSSNGEVQTLASLCLPLGVQKDLVVPCSSEIHLCDGQIVLLLTDGIYETFSPQHELFGLERTFDVVRSNCHRPANEIVRALCDAIEVFSGGQRQEDDVTVIVLKTAMQRP